MMTEKDIKEKNKLHNSIDQCPKHTINDKILKILVLIYYLSSLLPESNLFNLNMFQILTS